VHILIKNKSLTYNDYKVKCSVGKRGIGVKKREGDLITPIGTFKITKLLYRKDRLKNLKTCLKKTIINKTMGWCDDARSKSYNKLIRSPFKFTFEKLFRKDNMYDILLVLNFNMSPIKKHKGSAIFIHVAKDNYKKTKGCIAIKKKDLIFLLRKIDKNTKVKIT
tara:strand:+ start:2048 stop:2539 length:492 start_codon:yes stop_codon:yes gene_type:complete